MQEKFRALLEWGKSQKLIPEYFQIPEVLFQDTKYRGLQAHALIEGNSLFGVANKKRYYSKLAQYLRINGWQDDEIDQTIIDMTDYQVITILEK
jgi:hypothetical protein